MANKNYKKSYTDNQIQNRNFLAPVGFRFLLNRAPKVAFFTNTANIPGITLGLAQQPSYLKNIDLPGDKLEFEDFTLRFLVDENLENYMEIQNWMRGLGYPESLQEIFDLQNEMRGLNLDNKEKGLNLFSDGALLVLNSMQNTVFKVQFRSMFPYNLTTLDFDATDTDIDYFTAEVSFKYTIYELQDKNGNKL